MRVLSRVVWVLGLGLPGLLLFGACPESEDRSAFDPSGGPGNLPPSGQNTDGPSTGEPEDKRPSSRDNPDPNSPCGNGILDKGESCDGDDFNGKTCADFGFDQGELFCGQFCGIDASGCHACGDGVKQDAEDCDGSVPPYSTCKQVTGVEGGGALACAPDCTFDVSACASHPNCGNGTKEADEACDGQAFGGKTCGQQTNGALLGGVLVCAPDCSAVLTDQCTPTPVCGNNLQEQTESCDGTDLNEQTCETLGRRPGPLTCTANCGFDLSKCCAAVGEFCDNSADDCCSGCCMNNRCCRI